MAEKNKTRKTSTRKFHPSKYVEVNPTLEQPTKRRAVLTMGDFSPPSIADQRLVESMKRYAKMHEADSRVFVVSRDVSEGYLNEHQRIEMSRSVFGNIVHSHAVSNIREALLACESEYSSVAILCNQESADVVMSEVRDLRDELKYGSVQVIIHGDPITSDVIAEDIINGDFTSFKKNLATALRPRAQQIFEEMISDLSDLTEGYLEERIRPMSYLERIKKAQTMRRYAKRIQIAKERAANRRASPERLRERARKRALEIIRSRILRNKEYSELSNVEKNALDARLMNIPQAVIDRIAKRMMPVVRKAESERMNRTRGHHVSLSASSTGMRGHVNEAFGKYSDAIANQDQTLKELNDLIEAVETSNIERARQVISKEKKTDAIKHHQMVVAARRADINKQASAQFAKLQRNVNETSEYIQDIIQRELQRKNMLAAVKDYRETPNMAVLSNSDKEAVAKKTVAQHGLDPDRINDLEKMYNKFSQSKGHSAYLNIFDVTEAEENTPYDREWGTDSLTDIYKQQTPGQYIAKEKSKGSQYDR